MKLDNRTKRKKSQMEKEDKVSEKKSNKSQGERAKSKLMVSSDDRRSDAFAYAVKNILDEAKTMKGSEQGFLGVEKATLDPREYAHSLVKEEKK